MRKLGRLIEYLPIAAFLFILACSDDTPKNGPVSKQNKYFTVGSLSKEVRFASINFQPIADYIAALLDSTGKTKGRVLVARNFSELISLIEKKEIDIYIDSSFPVVSVLDKTNTSVLLVHFKDGLKNYNSILYTLKGSGIKSLSDLKGKIIAFDSPFSTSGYLLPKAYLERNGVDLVEIADTSSHVPEDKTGYIFTYDDDNVLLWVLKGKAGAGVTDSYYFSKRTGSVAGKLVKIAETEVVPRQLVLVRNDLPAGMTEKIKEILLKMHLDAEGRRILKLSKPVPSFAVLEGEFANTVNKIKKLMESTK